MLDTATLEIAAVLTGTTGVVTIVETAYEERITDVLWAGQFVTSGPQEVMVTGWVE